MWFGSIVFGYHSLCPLRHIPQQRLRKDILAGTMCFFDNMYDLVPCSLQLVFLNPKRRLNSFFTIYPLLDLNTQ